MELYFKTLCAIGALLLGTEKVLAMEGNVNEASGSSSYNNQVALKINKEMTEYMRLGRFLLDEFWSSNDPDVKEQLILWKNEAEDLLPGRPSDNKDLHDNIQKLQDQIDFVSNCLERGQSRVLNSDTDSIDFSKISKESVENMSVKQCKAAIAEGIIVPEMFNAIDDGEAENNAIQSILDVAEMWTTLTDKSRKQKDNSSKMKVLISENEQVFSNFGFIKSIQNHLKVLEGRLLLSYEKTVGKSSDPSKGLGHPYLRFLVVDKAIRSGEDVQAFDTTKHIDTQFSELSLEDEQGKSTRRISSSSLSDSEVDGTIYIGTQFSNSSLEDEHSKSTRRIIRSSSSDSEVVGTIYIDTQFSNSSLENEQGKSTRSISSSSSSDSISSSFSSDDTKIRSISHSDRVALDIDNEMKKHAELGQFLLNDFLVSKNPDTEEQLRLWKSKSLRLLLAWTSDTEDPSNEAQVLQDQVGLVSSCLSPASDSDSASILSSD